MDMNPAAIQENGTCPERVIVYIDGFNLYFGIRSKGWRRYLWLDLRQLAMNLLKPHQKLELVRYFTSRVSGTPADPDKSKRQNTYLEAVALLPSTTILYGHYLSKEVRCRNCGYRWDIHEEKMTDVNIAVALMNDAATNLFDTALLISGDSDLTGPVTEIRKLFPGKRVVVAFPPERCSARLRQEANASFTISRKVLKDSQFPDEVKKQDGYILRRPSSWV